MHGSNTAPGPPNPSDIVAAQRARLARLRAFLDEQGIDGAVLAQPRHLRYFCGWSAASGAAYLLVGRGAAALVAPAESASAERYAALGLDLVEYPGYSAERLIDPLALAAERAGEAARRLALRGRLALEPMRLPLTVAQALPIDEAVDLGPTLDAWQRVKDAVEQALLRERVAWLDSAFEAARAAVAPGRSELDVFQAAQRALLEQVSEPLLLDCTLASGPRTTLPDPRPAARRLESGDLVLVDLYPALDGYVADCTRTFVAGEPTPEQRARHAALELALAEAERLLRPGVAAREVDARVRQALADAGGYHATMRHHSGHGLGLLAWEEPWLGPESEAVLEVGNVVAVEPGLYLEGWGGMRLEGNYLITAKGCERLDRFPSVLLPGPG